LKTPLERLRELRNPTPRPISPAELREHNERAREEIDRFFSGPVMTGLSRLHTEGRLPSLDVPAWREVEAEWVKASEGSPLPCDVEKVKRLMVSFIEARGGTVPPEPPAPDAGPVRAVRIRHRRTKQEVVITSRVLAGWLKDGWIEVTTNEGRET
jgi:hypothetical protein